MMKKNRDAGESSEWASLVLPYLPPSSLASTSLVCKTFHRISTSVTARRVSDATRGLDNIPIPFRNTVDSQPYAYFLYTRSSLLPESSSLRQSWGGDQGSGPVLASASLPVIEDGSSGCSCEGGNCLGNTATVCPCTWLKPNLSGPIPEFEVMTECGPSCGCGFDCSNRATQRGVSVQLTVSKDERKGWALLAGQLIKRGEFVCEYAGELLTTEESRRRQTIYDNPTTHTKVTPSLLVVREHLPSGKACLRVNIDATRVGNVARFINHSCDGGNLLSILVRNSGSLVPRLCFFAARDVQEGEEITFSYGDVHSRTDGLPCFCGSLGCKEKLDDLGLRLTTEEAAGINDDVGFLGRRLTGRATESNKYLQ